MFRGLPKYVTDQRFKDFLVKFDSNITDAKVINATNGQSRCFGFVGYKTAKEAKKAKKHFHNTYFDTQLLTVEFALPQGDSQIARPWSKYSAGSSKHEEIQQKKDEKSKKRKAEEITPDTRDMKPEPKPMDPKLAEFLGVTMKKQKLWANDDVVGTNTVKTNEAMDDYSDSDSEEYQDLSMPPQKKVKVMETKDEESSDDEMQIDNANESSSESEVTQKPAKKEPKKEVEKKSKYTERSPDLITTSGRLYVRNLPFSATEEDLNLHFQKYGEIIECHLCVDQSSNKSKGYAFIQFLFPHHAVQAYQGLNGKIFQGRLIQILPAEGAVKINPKADKGREGFTSEYQQKKMDDMREKSQKDYNWNSLFMRSDTVASAMAQKYDVSKHDVLDIENNKDSMAVRLAIGETNIIAETKAFLAEEGIEVEALKGHYNPQIERSETVILAKSIPVSTQISELRSLFGKYGNVVRLVMPPSRTLAIIEMASPSESRAAFKALAFKLFKDAPLLLEKAPIGLFTPQPQVVEEVEEVALPEEDSESTTLFVKNLPFNATEADLEALLKEHNVKQLPVAKVTIAKHMKKGKMVSQGYGFVICKSQEQAVDVIKKLQKVQFQSHQLELAFSKRALPDTSALTNKRKKNVDKNASTKLMVRNVPFQATKKELQKLFDEFGDVQSVRLPSKAGGGGHRGFGFVVYLTLDQARAAKEALANTHLYDRRLVIEYAKEDENVEEIRQRTKEKFANLTN